jgi:hypothetical protein
MALCGLLDLRALGELASEDAVSGRFSRRRTLPLKNAFRFRCILQIRPINFVGGVF